MLESISALRKTFLVARTKNECEKDDSLQESYGVQLFHLSECCLLLQDFCKLVISLQEHLSPGLECPKSCHLRSGTWPLHCLTALATKLCWSCCSIVLRHVLSVETAKGSSLRRSCAFNLAAQVEIVGSSEQCTVQCIESQHRRNWHSISASSHCWQARLANVLF